MSWEQLLSIYKEAEAIKADEATQTPTACPNDGEPLVIASDGRPFCRFDGWRPPD